MMQFFNRRIFGIKWKEVIVLFLTYMFFAFLYHLTLWFNREGQLDPEDPLYNFNSFMDSGGLQYLLFFLLTIPVWLINFKLLRSWKLAYRLLAHLITLPLFVIIAQKLFYVTSEWMGYGHLQGSGQVWDIYIPALLYILQFGIFHAYEYFTAHQKKLKLEGELRTAALKSELSAIKAQLNPHFLYNVFNTINASVPPENEKTRQMIAELSDLFRYQLQASQAELVNLEDELEFVQKYLDLEKERFGDRLQIKIDVPRELYSERIPPMILQPIVENSVKHGLSTLIDGGEISIKIFKESEKLMFEIADTGIGAKDKEALLNKGIGLTNTNLRLQRMYESGLEILDNKPSGLKIKFSI